MTEAKPDKPAERYAALPEGGQMKQESGWLIESNWLSAKNKPMWLRLFGYVSDGKQLPPKPEWTEDATLALRFGRKQDAEWIALLYPEMCCLSKITEHVFGLD